MLSRKSWSLIPAKTSVTNIAWSPSATGCPPTKTLSGLGLSIKRGGRDRPSQYSNASDGQRASVRLPSSQVYSMRMLHPYPTVTVGNAASEQEQAHRAPLL